MIYTVEVRINVEAESSKEAIYHATKHLEEDFYVTAVFDEDWEEA